MSRENGRNGRKETGMQERVVVLLRTSSIARVPVYRYLVDMGVTFVLVHPAIPTLEFDGIFRHHLVHDTNDVDALEPVLVRFLADHGLTPDAIISFDEYAVYPAAVLARRLGRRPIPLPPEKLQRTSVKSLLREECAKIGLSSPASAVLTRPAAGTADLLAHVRRVLDAAGLTFPVVVKPCPGAGSLFARLCCSVEEVRDHALEMWDVFTTHSDVKHFEALLHTIAMKEMQILIEEYIGGQEVDLDCCVENGKIVFCAISDNFEVNPPFFLEEGGLCPTALPPREQRELLRLLEQFVAHHGADLHGVLHFEAKYDFERRRAFVIEVNCRLGSAETSTMIQTCYRGLQLGESLVRCALGLSVTEQLSRHYPEIVRGRGGDVCALPPSCYCASANIYPVVAGTLVRAEVPLADESLVGHNVSAAPGAFVAPPPKAFHLLAWMVASGPTAEETKASIARLRKNFVQEISVAR